MGTDRRRKAEGGVGKRGPTYDRLGYKRMILDLHYGMHRPDAIVDVSVDEITEKMAGVGIDSLLHFPRDHWGYLFTTGSTGTPHPNTPHDLFGLLQAALDRRGIVTTGYVSIHWDELAARQHPDWVMRNADGSPIRVKTRERRTDEMAHWTFLCLNSPYREYLLAHIEELLEGYDFEALWVDIINEHIGRDVSEGCYCSHCREKWETRIGSPMPTDLSDQDYIRWREQYTETQDELYSEIRQAIRRSGKDILTTHNRSYPYDFDDYITFESQPGGQDYFRPSRLAKFYRAYADGRETECVGYRFNQPWDFTTKPLPTLEFEVATAVAHNCAITFVDQPLLRGELDPRPYEVLAEAFKVADSLAPHVRGSVPYAEIALVAGDRSADLLKETHTDFAGAYCMLTESHLPFDVLADSLVPEADLSRFEAILVANTVHMMPEVVASLRRYVSEGGTLLFTNRAATLDIHGEPLQEPSFGLVSIVGDGPHSISFVAPTSAVSDTRLRVRDTVEFDTSDDVQVEAVSIPPAIDVTPDQWITHNAMPGPEDGGNAAVTGTFGRGRYIYIAPRIFAEYIKQDLPSIREWVMGLIGRHYQPSVWLEGPRAVEAVYQRQGDDLVVTLINGLADKPRAGGHNPIFDRGYVGMTETVPVAGLQLNFKGELELEASDHNGERLHVTVTAGDTFIELPTLDRYGLVRISGLDW